jgi:hypothetical protein
VDRNRVALRAVKSFHTLAWFLIEACMVYLLYAGVRGRTDRRAGVAATVVAGETLVFAAYGFHCPLTSVARRLGDESGSVTDIYLPRWFARNLPAIHVPLIVLAVALHRRNILVARATGTPPGRVPHAAGVCRPRWKRGGSSVCR